MNNAQRLHDLITKALRVPRDKTQALSAWAAAFGLDPSDGGDQEDVVTVMLQAVRDELAAVRHALGEAGVPTELYEAQFNAIRKVVSPARVNEAWDGVVADLRAQDRLLALAWAAWALPDESVEIPDDERAEFQSALDDLEAWLTTVELPPNTRSYVNRQVRGLRAALRLYDISGPTALQQAAGQCLAAVRSDRAAVEKEMESNTDARKAVNWINRGIGYAMGAFKGAKQIKDGGTALWDMADGTHKFLDWAKDQGGF